MLSRCQCCTGIFTVTTDELLLGSSLLETCTLVHAEMWNEAARRKSQTSPKRCIGKAWADRMAHTEGQLVRAGRLFLAAQALQVLLVQTQRCPMYWAWPTSQSMGWHTQLTPQPVPGTHGALTAASWGKCFLPPHSPAALFLITNRRLKERSQMHYKCFIVRCFNVSSVLSQQTQITMLLLLPLYR